MQAAKHYSERGAGTPPQNFKTGSFSRSCTDRGIKQPKSFARLFKWAAHKGIAFVHEFGAYAPNITGFGATPRESAFLFLSFSEQCEALFA